MQALVEISKQADRKPGRPQNTWLNYVKQELRETIPNLPTDTEKFLKRIQIEAKHRENWRQIVKCGIERKLWEPSR